MKKRLASLLFLLTLFVNAQESTNIDEVLVVKSDSIVYQKDTQISKARTLSPNLREKYNDKDFIYTEDAPVQKKKTSNTGSGFLGGFAFFMTTIFPFLLGGFIIFVIVKVMLGSDIRFWKSSPASTKIKEKLIYEDEDIHEVDLASLLKQAIDNQNYRLAIRYYYLTSLKGLSNKKIIEYHKDKTNSEYLFEIENPAMRTQFSYLSYVYSYVWYGEFPVDETNFKTAANKYQSFINSMS
jgi:hypothetical protein